MDQMLDMLLNGGPLGLFAAFLIYERTKAEKKLDAWMSKWQGELKEMQERAEAAEDKLRDRYDAVVASKSAELNDQREKIIALLSDIKRDTSESRARAGSEL